MRLGRFLFVLCFAGMAHGAFTVEPALINIQANMGERSGWATLTHTGGGPMAIELVLYERVLDIDGELRMDSLKKSGDFMVHPSALILQPNEKKTVQVVLKGKQKITADKAYILFSKEAPLPIGDDGEEGVKTGISVLMNYYTVVAINTGRPGKLTFVSSKSIGDGKIEVIVENKSQGRVAIDRFSMTVNRQRVTEFTGRKNSIMPGQRRRFTFKHPKPVTAKDVTFGY